MATTLKAPASGQIKYMRGLPADQLLAAMPDFRKGLADAKLNMDVGMDGYAVPEFTASVYAAGRQAHIPMIVGNNAQDMPGLRAPPNATTEQVNDLIKGRLTQIYGAYPDLMQKAEAAYRTPSTYPPYGAPEAQAGVDYSFRCTGAAVARWQSAVAPTWQYEFSAGDAAHPPSHSGELDYVFGYLRDRTGNPTLVKLSEQMQLYWTNFARTGNPNGASLPAWPRYDGQVRSYIEFSNTGPMEKADLRGPACPLYFDKINRDVVAMN
jgi:para-nitrobenzyl esterase